jgi:hypothetical protein
MTTANISINTTSGAITVKQGTTVSWAYVLKVGATAVNVTGYTARFQVRKTFDSSDALLSLTTSSGIAVDGPNGKFTLSLSPSATTDIAFKGEELEGVYDVEVVDTSGTVTRIAEGTFTITREVTR